MSHAAIIHVLRPCGDENRLAALGTPHVSISPQSNGRAARLQLHGDSPGIWVIPSPPGRETRPSCPHIKAGRLTYRVGLNKGSGRAVYWGGFWRISSSANRKHFAGICAPTGRREDMPEVVVYALGGRSLDQKRGLMKDITDAVVKNYKVEPGAVVVTLVESEKQDKMKGGVLFSEAAPR
jgi:4-oxalocrotonate tautomerase